MKLKIVIVPSFVLLLGLIGNITITQTELDVQVVPIKIGISSWAENIVSQRFG